MPAISERDGSRRLAARRAALTIAGAALGWALLAAGAHAQVAAEVHETTGFGADRSEAIGKALQQAAFQVCGVTLESDTASAVSLAVGTEGMEVVESLNEHIRISLGSDACRFTGYEVLSSTRDGGGVQVRVRVSHASYRVPGPDVDRRRLAVLDFEIDEVHLYGAGGQREQRSGGQTARSGVDVDFDLIRNLQERFRARIESLLTQGRRFAVLDRRAGDLYEQEKRLLQSADVDAAEGARLGKVLGADYLLYGTVDRIAVEERRTNIQLTGESRTSVLAAAQVRFSVLAVATRQIKWSSAVDLVHDADEEWWPEQLAEAVLDDAAARIVDELTENIYPPMVLQVMGGGAVAVNRGGNTVAAGDLFEVFALGPVLIDPDTGESLGRLEMPVGVVRITTVKPKYSVAQIVTADAGVTADMVLRRYHGDLDLGGGAAVGADAAAAPNEGDRNYRRADGDGDGDGLPDYLNRDAEAADGDGDGLPDYLNRDNLRRT